jgi:hypothetical protein
MAAFTSIALGVAAAAAVAGAGISAYEQIARQRKENKRFAGMQRAAIAKSGAVLGEGSPLLLEAETAGLMELQVQDARRSAQIQARSLRAQGAMGLYSARREASALQIGAGATLFQGVGQGLALGAQAYGASNAAKAAASAKPIK